MGFCAELDPAGNKPQLPGTHFSDAADFLIRRVGEVVSWTWLILLLVIMTNVMARYVFGRGLVEFEEIQWHLYSIGFLCGLSYCMQTDNHVRIDILHERMGLRTRARIELCGLIFFLLPFILLVVYNAVPFVAYSWSVNEISDAPGGLPARWAIKSMLIVGFLLLGLAAVSRLTRVTALLIGFPRPLPQSKRQTHD